MRSLGFPELLVILGVAVLLSAARKFPKSRKGLGEGIRNFKHALKVTKRRSKKRSRRRLRGSARKLD